MQLLSSGQLPGHATCAGAQGPAWFNALLPHVEILNNLRTGAPHVHFVLSPTDEVAGPGCCEKFKQLHSRAGILVSIFILAFSFPVVGSTLDRVGTVFRLNCLHFSHFLFLF